VKVLRNCNHLLSGPAQSSLALAAWCLGEVYRSTPCESRKFENGGFACLRQAIFHHARQLLCLGEPRRATMTLDMDMAPRTRFVFWARKKREKKRSDACRVKHCTGRRIEIVSKRQTALCKQPDEQLESRQNCKPSN
jgi:hypothetical protein